MAKGEGKFRFKNCSCCELRRTCGTWNTERYGDYGERGKLPFPDNCVCMQFKYDKGKGNF